ncbi:MAG: hypothetical protein ACTSPV_00835 [Candidatus Hodarchaeales archaeon]
MAGSIDISYQEIRTIKKITFDWTSDSSGNVSGIKSKTLSGEITRMVFIPDSGATQPSDGYDAVLLDENGVDILAGQGTNLSNSSTDIVVGGVEITYGANSTIIPVVIDDQLELQISNAGDSKGGKVIIYMR